MCNCLITARVMECLLWLYDKCLLLLASHSVLYKRGGELRGLGLCQIMNGDNWMVDGMSVGLE